MNAELETRARLEAEKYLRKMYSARGERWEDEPQHIRDNQVGQLLIAARAALSRGESDVPPWVPGVLERLEEEE